MKYQSKDIYGPYDSPNTFCQYQIELTDNKFTCNARLWDDIIEHIDEEIDEGTYEAEMEKKCQCTFTEQTACKCLMFKYHKNDKNPNAKRYKT